MTLTVTKWCAICGDHKAHTVTSSGGAYHVTGLLCIDCTARKTTISEAVYERIADAMVRRRIETAPACQDAQGQADVEARIEHAVRTELDARFNVR